MSWERRGNDARKGARADRWPDLYAFRRSLACFLRCSRFGRMGREEGGISTPFLRPGVRFNGQKRVFEVQYSERSEVGSAFVRTRWLPQERTSMLSTREKTVNSNTNSTSSRSTSTASATSGVRTAWAGIKATARRGPASSRWTPGSTSEKGSLHQVLEGRRIWRWHDITEWQLTVRPRLYS